MTLTVLTACSTGSSPGISPALQSEPRVAPMGPKTSGTDPVEQRLKATVLRWTGTPHRLGGNDRSGIDCSAFVRRIYRDVFDIGLPRTTSRQVEMGNPVNRRNLRIADLIFFKPPQKVRHVGIYLGNGEFAHASSRRGVTISQLKNPYWKNAFWTAKRILPSRTGQNR